MGRSWGPLFPVERMEEEKAVMIPKETNGSLRNRIQVFLGLACGLAFLFGVTIRLAAGKSWLYTCKMNYNEKLFFPFLTQAALKLRISQPKIKELRK